MRDLDWINTQVSRFVATALELFENDENQHDKVRIYINDRTQSVNIVSLSSGMGYTAQGDQELCKDSSTHLSLIRNFEQIDKTQPDWAEKSARRALACLEPRF